MLCVAAWKRWEDDPPSQLAHPHQAFGVSLPAPVSTHYMQSKKGLFQLLETKGAKWEPSPPCPTAEGRQ